MIKERRSKRAFSRRRIGLLRMTTLLKIIIASYLLGSIPFGYLLVRIFHGEDVRQSGSGNIGATNVARKSPVLGATTLVLDALKGAGAVAFAAYVVRPTQSQCIPISQRYVFLSMAALFAILGHMFPVWLKFRGGKGVATALGSFALISPGGVLVSGGIFVIVTAIFRFVSLGSIAAAGAFPVLVWSLQSHAKSRPALALISLSSLLIIFKHRGNIRRLLAGTENRFGSQRN
jgi:acyl phosphate:glycerol-3-phosphate acyltransferase